jgi:KaiC/GvpD/RAD55 family RecA-like ATPase
MEQRTILTNPNNKRIVITGKPDTGKTLLLKTKAMELLNANVNTKILYVINPQNPRRVLDLDVSQIRNRQKTKKKYVNMHMQTKFFLWEGLVELLL